MNVVLGADGLAKVRADGDRACRSASARREIPPLIELAHRGAPRDSSKARPRRNMQPHAGGLTDNAVALLRNRDVLEAHDCEKATCRSWRATTEPSRRLGRSPSTAASPCRLRGHRHEFTLDAFRRGICVMRGDELSGSDDLTEAMRAIASKGEPRFTKP